MKPCGIIGEVIALIIILFLIYGANLALMKVTSHEIVGIHQGGRLISGSVGYGIGVYDYLEEPTFEEVESFIEKDDTNENHYSSTFPCYMCREFSKDLISNAKKEGMKVGYVTYSEYGEEDHMVVAFKLSDGRTMIVEPQSDEFFFYDKNVHGRYSIDWCMVG